MPLYFFHVDNNPSFTDEEGLELAGPREARDQALDYAGQLLRESSEYHTVDGTPLIVRVTEGFSVPIMTIEVRVTDTSSD